MEISQVDVKPHGQILSGEIWIYLPTDNQMWRRHLKCWLEMALFLRFPDAYEDSFLYTGFGWCLSRRQDSFPSVKDCKGGSRKPMMVVLRLWTIVSCCYTRFICCCRNVFQCFQCKSETVIERSRSAGIICWSSKPRESYTAWFMHTLLSGTIRSPRGFLNVNFLHDGVLTLYCKCI